MYIIATHCPIFSHTLYINYFSRSFTTLPGSDIMPGLVPEGARCGTNMVNILYYIGIKVFCWYTYDIKLLCFL